MITPASACTLHSFPLMLQGSNEEQHLVISHNPVTQKSMQVALSSATSLQP